MSTDYPPSGLKPGYVDPVFHDMQLADLQRQLEEMRTANKAQQEHIDRMVFTANQWAEVSEWLGWIDPPDVKNMIVTLRSRLAEKEVELGRLRVIEAAAIDGSYCVAISDARRESMLVAEKNKATEACARLSNQLMEAIKASSHLAEELRARVDVNERSADSFRISEDDYNTGIGEGAAVAYHYSAIQVDKLTAALSTIRDKK